MHGCPHYGPATYDEEGYNQDGFHQDTGFNREGLTRRQDLARARGEDPDEGDGGAEEVDNPEWEVLQHMDPAERAVLNMLPEEEREEALDNLRIQLHDTQGLIFGQDQARNNEHRGDDEEGGAGDDGLEGDRGNQDEDEIDPRHEEHLDPRDNGDRINGEEAPHGNRFAWVQNEDDVGLAPELDHGQITNSLDDNTSNASSAAQVRNLEAQGIDLNAHTQGLTSSASDSDDFRPETPIETDQPSIEQSKPIVEPYAPPGAWLEDDLS